MLFDVTFATESGFDYGALSNRKLDEQKSGARVAVEIHKRNPADFVLWKESDTEEPGWPATFEISNENREQLQANSNSITVYGRPGWHIECSAMSKAFLGETFDIHGGGLDLIFPHHENEIAQSCCANGTDRMANVWMHNGYLQVEGKKMSKSDGNFITVHDLLHTEKVGGRKWPGEVVRLAILMTHYREPLDFTVTGLNQAERLLNDAALACSETITTADEALFQTQPVLGTSFSDILDNDLSTGQISGVVMPLLKTARRQTDVNSAPQAAVDLIKNFRFLGFDLGKMLVQLAASVSGSITAEAISQQIEWRRSRLMIGNYSEADRIRDELLSQGIQLKDSKDPETGERVTTWEVVR